MEECYCAIRCEEDQLSSGIGAWKSQRLQIQAGYDNRVSSVKTPTEQKKPVGDTAKSVKPENTGFQV